MTSRRRQLRVGTLAPCGARPQWEGFRAIVSTFDGFRIRSRRVCFFLTAPSTLSGMGVTGWIPLFLSAGLAMGGAAGAQIGVALAAAGVPAIRCLALSVLGLARGRFVDAGGLDDQPCPQYGTCHCARFRTSFPW